MTREPAQAAPSDPLAGDRLELADDGRSGQASPERENPYDPGMIRQIDETVIQGVHS